MTLQMKLDEEFSRSNFDNMPKNGPESRKFLDFVKRHGTTG